MFWCVLIPATSHTTSILSDSPAMAAAAERLEYYVLISVLKQSSFGIIRLFIDRYKWNMIKSHEKLYHHVVLWTFYAYINAYIYIVAEIGNHYFRHFAKMSKIAVPDNWEQKLLALHVLVECCGSQVKFQPEVVLPTVYHENVVGFNFCRLPSIRKNKFP